MIASHSRRAGLIAAVAAVTLLAYAAPCHAEREALPKELAGLRPLLDDEERAVEAVHTFDQMCRALMKWDKALAERAARQGEQETARDCIERMQKRLDLVVCAYKELLARYPENPRAQTYYGEVLYDYLGDQAAAVEAWLRAEKSAPGWGIPLNNLALHYCHNGEVERGIRYSERALECDPENPDFLFNSAQIHFNFFPEIQRLRSWDKPEVYRAAMEMSGKAARIDPLDFELAHDYALNFFAGANFGVEVDWDQAATAWQQARTSASNPEERFNTWINEARAWRKKPDLERAEACLVDALAILPGNPAAERLLATVRAERSGEAHGAPGEAAPSLGDPQ